jgi:hypothetical protein
MKIEKYIEQLQDLAEKYPNAKVVYSTDDEGNGFGLVHHDPCAGNFRDGEFTNGELSEESVEINAICIN